MPEAEKRSLETEEEEPVAKKQKVIQHIFFLFYIQKIFFFVFHIIWFYGRMNFE